MAYLLPYLAVLVATWLMLGFASHRDLAELIVAAALQVLVGGLVWAWRPSRSSTPRFVIGTAALLASIGLIRDAGGSNPGVSVLVLLPIIFAAVRAGRGEFIFALVLSAVTLYGPDIVIAGPQYGSSRLIGITLILLVAGAVGSTVLVLVSSLRDAQARQRRLTEEARSQLVTEDALREVATLVAAGAPAAELFSEVSLQLARVAGSSMGAVVRYDSDLNIGVMVGGWRFDRVLLSGRRLDLTRGTVTARVYQTGKPVTLHAYSEQDTFDSAVGGVGAPIFVRGRLWGSATVGFTRGQEIPEGLQSRFERFAELVSMAIANADQVSRLVEHATTDALTGIPNRRTFDEQLNRELERASRRGRPLALALLDVDHFKTVNDTHGHQVGDQVLAEIADLLRVQARAGETVARLGGEEFVWLMPETTAEEAVMAADRARIAVSALMLDTVGRVTLSAGVSSNLAESTSAGLLGSADEALYEAKSRGRDQTVAASASISSAEDRVNPAAA